ncbi:MAG: hypothetical protein Q9197_006252 [Variospora fuerteventurae]
MRYGDNAQDSPPAKSYRLSKDLGADDYLTFGQMRPFVAKGKDAKKGCHELKYESFTFHPSTLVLRLSETLFLDAAVRHELRKFPPCNHVQAGVDPSRASNQKLGCCQLATETPTALYPDAFYSCTLLAYLALACNERLQALRNYPGGAMDVGPTMSIGGNNRSSIRLWRPVKILSWPILRRTDAKRAAISKRSILDEYVEHAMPIALILPVQIAACYLDETLDTISAMAMAEWARQTPESSMLTLSNESISLTFASSIPVPWQFIMFLCDNLANQAQRGWTGIYRGIWIHATTQVMIAVQMRITMVAAAA